MFKFDFKQLVLFIFVGLMGFLIFAEVPTYSIYLGGLVIIASGIFIAYRERKNN